MRLIRDRNETDVLNEHQIDTIAIADTGTYIENFYTSIGQIIDSRCMIRVFQGRYIPSLYDLAHVAGWQLYNLHDLGHVSWVRPVLCRSCIAPQSGRLGSRLFI